MIVSYQSFYWYASTRLTGVFCVLQIMVFRMLYYQYQCYQPSTCSIWTAGEIPGLISLSSKIIAFIGTVPGRFFQIQSHLD